MDTRITGNMWKNTGRSEYEKSVDDIKSKDRRQQRGGNECYAANNRYVPTRLYNINTHAQAHTDTHTNTYTQKCVKR